MKKKFALLLLFVMILAMFAGCAICSEAKNVNYNLNQSADNFECLRKITVYNARTDMIVMELEGYMSLSNNSANELVVTCKTGEKEYKKNHISLNDYVIYVVEDITGTVTDPFHYKVHYYAAIPDIDLNH